jgi:hypothetical protein
MVDAMAIHPAKLTEQELLADCDIARLRRGGPGGQHRNKVETAVAITHRPTGIRGEASERRSQAENLRVAVGRLRVRLAVEIRPTEFDLSAAPSELWRSRVSRGRLSINATHIDFPALLAEALDVVTLAEFDVAAAAKTLGITTTQLVRFLQEEPAARTAINNARRQRGLRPLH